MTSAITQSGMTNQRGKINIKVPKIMNPPDTIGNASHHAPTMVGARHAVIAEASENDVIECAIDQLFRSSPSGVRLVTA